MSFKLLFVCSELKRILQKQCATLLRLLQSITPGQSRLEEEGFYKLRPAYVGIQHTVEWRIMVHASAKRTKDICR